MTVKDHVGRTRHVAFRVTPADGGERGTLRRSDVLGAIRGILAHEWSKDVLEAADPRLTIWTGTHGIVRTRHTHRDLLLEALERITWMGSKDRDVSVEPLGTSGTIRGAKRFIPAEDRPPRRRPWVVRKRRRRGR